MSAVMRRASLGSEAADSPSSQARLPQQAGSKAPIDRRIQEVRQAALLDAPPPNDFSLLSNRFSSLHSASSTEQSDDPNNLYSLASPSKNGMVVMNPVYRPESCDGGEQYGFSDDEEDRMYDVAASSTEQSGDPEGFYSLASPSKNGMVVMNPAFGMGGIGDNEGNPMYDVASPRVAEEDLEGLYDMRTTQSDRVNPNGYMHFGVDDPLLPGEAGPSVYEAPFRGGNLREETYAPLPGFEIYVDLQEVGAGGSQLYDLADAQQTGGQFYDRATGEKDEDPY